MTSPALIAFAVSAASAGVLALFLARGRLPGRLFFDALAVGLTLGAGVAVAMAPFDLRANPLHLSPLTLAFLFAGAPEEGVKLVGVAAFLAPHYLTRDRRDVVFAAGALSLGFAALENLFYLANAGAGWATLAFERALTATPFHVFAGLAGGYAVAAARPGFAGVARVVLAWGALASIHAAYDFAVFAGASGAAANGFSGVAAAFGLDPALALRSLLCAAEAAMAVAGGAAAASVRPRHAARPGRWLRLLDSSGVGWGLGALLVGASAAALAAGGLTAFMLESVDLWLRVAVYAAAPLALGLLFLVAPGLPASRRAWRLKAAAGAAAALIAAIAGMAYGPSEWRELKALRFEARAARLAARGDFARAVDAYGQALAVEPDRIEALSLRAQSYAALKRFDAALADVDAALRAAPETVALYVERGDLDRRRNRPEAAASDLDAALRRRPGDPELMALRAEARLEAGDPQGARADLDEAARAGRDNAVVRRVSAAVSVDVDDFDGALRELNAALHANPADAVAAFQRGRVWLYKGEFARAAEDFARAETPAAGLYPALWRFLAQARLGQDGAAELRQRLAAAPADWPAPIARHLLRESGAGPGGDGELCEWDFYSAMASLAEDGAETLRKAKQECPTGFVEYEGAKAELRVVAP